MRKATIPFFSCVTWVGALVVGGPILMLGLANPLESFVAEDQVKKAGQADNETSRRPTAAAVSEQVRIPHGPHMLAGVLHLPKNRGPHPVVIFIHGSGPADRTWGGRIAPFWDCFLESGFACLSWDKPGIGGSTNSIGRYAEQSFFQRAAELRRAVDFLKARPDIEPKRIGCWGISQAGWIMPLVASQSQDIAFVIAVSCPGQTAAEQWAYLLRRQALGQGASVEQVDRAIASLRSISRLLPASKPPSGHLEYLAGSNPDYVVGPHQGPVLDGSMLLDPVPLLEKMTCPVLAIFGTEDRMVDPIASAQVYRKSFEKTGSQLSTVKMFAGADHGLRVPDSTTADTKESRSTKRAYAPGYFDAMSNWLKDLPPPNRQGKVR